MITYSIIQKSQLEGAHRLDAEYYQPEYLSLISKIKFQKSKLLRNYLKTLYRYPTFYNLNYYDKGVLVLKGEDISSESHNARKKAKQLLEQAKNKVENLIEAKS